MSQHHKAHWTSTDSIKWRAIFRPLLPLPCLRCGALVYGDTPWQIDHIVEVSQGGTNTADNLHPAHRRCNAIAGGKLGAKVTNAKRGKVIKEGRMFEL